MDKVSFNYSNHTVCFINFFLHMLKISQSMSTVRHGRPADDRLRCLSPLLCFALCERLMMIGAIACPSVSRLTIAGDISTVYRIGLHILWRHVVVWVLFCFVITQTKFAQKRFFFDVIQVGKVTYKSLCYENHRV